MTKAQMGGILAAREEELTKAKTQLAYEHGRAESLDQQRAELSHELSELKAENERLLAAQTALMALLNDPDVAKAIGKVVASHLFIDASMSYGYEGDSDYCQVSLGWSDEPQIVHDQKNFTYVDVRE